LAQVAAISRPSPLPSQELRRSGDASFKATDWLGQNEWANSMHACARLASPSRLSQPKLLHISQSLFGTPARFELDRD
jgi:hypothetical protein